MKFKQLRDLIFCSCNVIKGNEEYKNIDTHSVTDFDEDEVIGIRSRDRNIGGYSAGSYVEVLVK